MYSADVTSSTRHANTSLVLLISLHIRTLQCVLQPTHCSALQTLQSTQMSSTGILKVLEVKLLSADWGVVEGLRWVGVAREEAGLGVLEGEVWWGGGCVGWAWLAGGCSTP